MTNLFVSSHDELSDCNSIGSGRKKRKLVIADKDGLILFIARVTMNRPSQNILGFENGEKIRLPELTRNGQSVRFFLFKRADSYAMQKQQQLVKEIFSELKLANSGDQKAFLDCIQDSVGHRIPEFESFFSDVRVSAAKQRLLMMSLKQLRELRPILGSGTPIAA